MTTIRARFFAVMLLLFPGLAPAQPANSGPTPAASAQDFVIDFMNGWSRPNAKALPFIRSFINDPINFYGKVISRDTYMKTQEAFLNHWPDRTYLIEPGSEKIDCTTIPSTCNVSGIEYWDDYSPARHLMSTGSADFTMSLHLQKNGTGKTPPFLIAAESGSVISSDTDNAIGISDVLLGPAAGGNFAAPSPNSPQLVTDAAIQKAGCISPAGPLQHENCTSVFAVDLTKAFHTEGRTVFEITQASYDQNQDFAPPLSFCFIHRNLTQCQYGLYPGATAGPDNLIDTSYIYPTTNAYHPLLRARLSTEGGAGCGGLYNVIWAYNPANAEFNLIWTRPFDCHTTLRFESQGPLAGDMIAVDDDVTGRWPWPYGMEVYKFVPPAQLRKILYLVGRAGQGGKYVTGPNDAIDVDMPEMLRRLGVSQ